MTQLPSLSLSAQISNSTLTQGKGLYALFGPVSISPCYLSTSMSQIWIPDHFPSLNRQQVSEIQYNYYNTEYSLAMRNAGRGNKSQLANTANKHVCSGCITILNHLTLLINLKYLLWSCYTMKIRSTEYRNNKLSCLRFSFSPEQLH